MAALIETTTWESEIYMWQTDDPVIGGPSGLDNLPTTQLASRTGWLRKQITDHAAATDPHPQYLSAAEGAAAFDKISAASDAIATHASANDPHPAYYNQARGDTRYARGDHAHAGLYETAGSAAAHLNAADPHGQYLNQARGDARYALAGAESGVANHLAAADPHSQYLNLTRANALYALLAHSHTGVYEPAGSITTHTNSPDPHTQYHTNARGDARYSRLGHAHAESITGARFVDLQFSTGTAIDPATPGTQGFDYWSYLPGKDTVAVSGGVLVFSRYWSGGNNSVDPTPTDCTDCSTDCSS